MSDLPTLLDRKARQSSNQNEKLEYLAIRAMVLRDHTELLKEFGID